MANAPRYRYGDANPVKVPWKATFAINIGDCCFLDSSDTVTPPDQSSTMYPVKAAGSYTWQSAITDPTTAPTISANASPLGPGFTVAGAGFKVAYTYVTLAGAESTASSLSSAMNTNGNGINVQLAAGVPAGVYAVNWYVTTDGGNASTLRLAATTVGGSGTTLASPPASDAQQPPATSQVTALALTQAAFAKNFVGVSAQYYGGDAITATTLAYGVKDGYMRMDTGGAFDFACASATFNEGDLVGLAKATGNALDPQTVIAVATQSQAIGKVVQGGVSITTVRVMIQGQRNLTSRPQYPKN